MRCLSERTHGRQWFSLTNRVLLWVSSVTSSLAHSQTFGNIVARIERQPAARESHVVSMASKREPIKSSSHVRA